MQTSLIIALSLVVSSLGFAADRPAKFACDDSVSAVATVVPNLDSRLFHETKTSLNWWITENESGYLEDTMDGNIEPGDLVRIERMAGCTSTHQGKHMMEFCDAVREGESIRLSLSGGMPAYASDLSVIVEPSLAFRCSFSATYPASTSSLRWKITRKELRLRSRDFTPGHRVFGWISVTFEETDGSDAPPRTYKIEGYLKPVIQHQGQT